MRLTDPVTSIRGIGPKKAAILSEHGIADIEDLLYLFPRSYEDRRRVTPISEAAPGSTVLIEAEVTSLRAPGGRRRRNSPLSLVIRDGTGSAEAVFFNAGFLSNLFAVGSTYVFYGKVSENFARKQLIHPEFARSGSAEDRRSVIPVYPDIQGFSQKELRRIQSEIAPLYEKAEEWIPGDIVASHKLASPAYALRNIHFPSDGRKVLESRYRMVFGELFTLETGLIYLRNGDAAAGAGVRIDCAAGDRYAAELPYELTSGQKSAWQDIRRDLESGRRMNRLLQGDVGSGKTVIAEMAMYSCARAGRQSVIMVPTELLARQHYETYRLCFAQYGIRPLLLISSMSPADKHAALKSISDGSALMVIATHAVLQENVNFSDLALVITDEQHRFGVNQRRALAGKGEGANVLVMTATPIPRTLAVILYGDLDISQIRTMPKGRRPVKTTLVGADERDRAYDFAVAEIKKGRQCYVVAPLIDKSDRIEANSAVRLYEELIGAYPDLRIGLVHGDMKQGEKDLAMRAFAAGDTDMLVSTVLIEVGINVPNATVMIIENAERFGLAQMHQLRGRVGRGAQSSYCFLLTDSSSEIAMKRAEIMCRTTDGFEIAEKDLELRGPGEIFGTRQHGLPQLVFSDLSRHSGVLEDALRAAKEVMARDPSLTEACDLELKKRVIRMFGETISLDL